jgi:hypothetical protein
MKKVIVGASMLAGLAACAAPGAQGSEVLGETTAAVSGGTTYQIKFPSLSNKCADVSSNSGADGANVQLWVCNGSSAQNWIANDKGGGYFSFTHSGTGECLNRSTNVSAGTDGANVQQWTCQWDGSAEYQWRFESINGYQRMINRYDNKCLDVNAASSADGANIQTWVCNGSAAQTVNMVSGGGGGGGGGGGIAGIIDQNTFNSWFPSRNGLYSWSGFVSMNNKYPDIANQGDINLRKREVAALLAHFAHETGDFYYTQEINPTCGCDTSRSYGCPAGSCNYFGRGWTQLTWNFNYNDAGNALGYDLLHNPGWVSSDANISAQTAAWYWATQYGPGGYGANSHQAISDSNGGGGFGQTIWHVNGSLECNGSNTAQMNDRINRYRTYCDRLGCSGYGNNIGC